MRTTEGSYDDDRREYSKPSYTDEWVKCETCKGTGKIVNPHFADPNNDEDCEDCDGKGGFWEKTGAMW